MKRNNLTEKQKRQAERVFEKVEQLIGVPKERITSLSRLRELVYIRTAIVNAFLNNGWTLGNVGAIFDKDHTAIIHLRTKYQNMLFSANHSDEANEYIQLSKCLSDFVATDCNLPLNNIGRIMVAKEMTAKGSNLNAILGVLNN